MKKLLATTIAAGLVLTGINSTTEAATPCAPVKSKSVKLPDLKDQKIVNQMIKGTYSYRGIKVGMKQSDAVKIIGKPMYTHRQNMDIGQINLDQYTNFGLFSRDKNRKLSAGQLKLNGYGFDVINEKPIYKNELKLPKADIVDDLGPDVRNEHYGHLLITYVKDSKGYKVSGISINQNDGFIEQIGDYTATTKMNSEKLRAFTSKDLKAMKAGNFSYNNVKLGMTPTQVDKTVGLAKETTYERKNLSESLEANYKAVNSVHFKYTAKCSPLQLKKMTFDYEYIKSGLSYVEKSLGKPLTTKKSTFAMNGVKFDKLVYTYPHLTVTSHKKQGSKVYKVTEIQYY